MKMYNKVDNKIQVKKPASGLNWALVAKDFRADQGNKHVFRILGPSKLRRESLIEKQQREIANVEHHLLFLKCFYTFC